MRRLTRNSCALASAFLVAFTVPGSGRAQIASGSLPNPYRAIENWRSCQREEVGGKRRECRLIARATCGFLSGANTCVGRSEAPILEFDSLGRLVKSFGVGMFVFPHALFVDKEDNVWVTDADGKDGKGQQVCEVQPQWKNVDDAGQGRRCGRRAGYVQSPLGSGGRAEWRHLRGGRPRWRIQRTRRENSQRKGNSSRLGERRGPLRVNLMNRTGSPSIRKAGSASPTVATTGFRSLTRMAILSNVGRNSVVRAEFFPTRKA